MSKVVDTEQSRKLSIEIPDNSALITPATNQVDCDTVECAKSLVDLSKSKSPNTPQAPITKERRESIEQMQVVDEIVSNMMTKLLQNVDLKIDYQEEVDDEDLDNEDVDNEDVDNEDVNNEDVDNEDADDEIDDEDVDDDIDDDIDDDDNLTNSICLDNEDVKTIMNLFNEMSKEQAAKQLQQWNSDVDEDKFREEKDYTMKEVNIDTPEDEINIKLNENDEEDMRKQEEYIDEINNNILEINDADVSESNDEESPREKYLKNLEFKMINLSEELNEKQIYLEDLQNSIDNKLIKLDKKKNKYNPLATFISNISVVFFFSWGILKVVNLFGSR